MSLLTKLFFDDKTGSMSFPKYYFKNKDELFFQQKLEETAGNMKKFVPLIIILCLIFYGIFSSYKKKYKNTLI